MLYKKICKKSITLLLVVFFFFNNISFSQSVVLKGVINDTINHKNLTNTVVSLIRLNV